MKKFILLFLFHSYLLFSASSEQILQYLSLSHSEEQLLNMASVFESMREKQERQEDNESTSDVAIIYQEYLEEHISSNEIEEILSLYRTPAMERYVSEVKNFEVNPEDMEAFLKSLEEEPLLNERMDLIDSLVNALVNDELQLNFYRSMMQRYPQSQENNNSDSNSSSITSREKSYLDSLKESTKNQLLYGTQVFSMEELKELKEAMESSIFSKIKKVENEALVKIMNDFIRGILSKPKEKEEKKKR